jgi:hypothetical protein
MDEPMLFDDFHVHNQAADIVRRCSRLCRPRETPRHPSWRVGQLWLQGRVILTIAKNEYTRLTINERG